jgi:branched-chain amino acid transport system substrate-binding protein
VRVNAAITAIAVGLGLSLAACGSSGSTAAGGAKPVIMWMSAALSGSDGPSQELNVIAARLAVKAINKAGGILGRPVDLEVVDNQGDPTVAVSQLQQALQSSSPPDIVVPAGGTLTTSAELPITTRAKLFTVDVDLLPNAGDISLYPYNFQYEAPPSAYGGSLAAYVKAQGYKKAGVLIENTAASLSVGAGDVAALKAQGIDVVSTDYSSTALDVTAQLSKLQAQGPQALVLSAEGGPAGVALASIQKIGWRLPVIGDILVGASSITSITNTSLLAYLKSNNDFKIEVFAGSTIPPSQRSAALNAFVKEVRAQGPITQPITTYEDGWDYVWIAALAANQAKSLSGPAMTQALEHFKAPANPPYLSYATLPYTPTNHTIPPNDKAFAIVPAGPPDANGFYAS